MTNPAPMHSQNLAIVRTVHYLKGIPTSSQRSTRKFTNNPPAANECRRFFLAIRMTVGLWLFALGLIGAPFPDLAAQGVTISGKVTDARTGASLPGMLITLRSAEGGLIDTVSTDGIGEWSYTIPSVGVVGTPLLPKSVVLGQNYPNPFNPTTKIPFQINQYSVIRLAVYNILGQRLDSKEYSLSPGSYSVDWQGKGSAGVLFCTMEVGGVRYVRKMVQMEGSGGAGIGKLTTYSGALPPALRKTGSQSCWVGVNGFAYEPDSVFVALEGSPRADFAIATVHDRAFVVDLHNDVLEKIVGSGYLYDIGVRHSTAHTDLPRMRDGGLDAQMLSVWLDPTAVDPSQYYARSALYLDSLSAQVARNSARIGFAVNTDSVTALNANGRIAGILLLEGGHSIAEDLENLKYFYARGVRCMTITWNNSTSWAVSAKDARSATVGLSEFGKQVIRTMDSLKMIIDISHVGKKTVEDILSIAKGPVIASHSGCAALNNHYRNLTDDQIRAIAATGGVIGVVFYPPFLKATGVVTTETIADHIDHIRNLVGTDYIALGSDFDGIEVTPVGMEDVSKLPELTKILLRRGYTREDIRKILGGNFLRVFQSVCN